MVLEVIVFDGRIVKVILPLAVVVLVLERVPVLVLEIRADRLTAADALTLALAVGVLELRILRVGVGEPVVVFDLRALIVKLGVAVCVFVWTEEADVVFVSVIVRVDEEDAVIVLDPIPE